jgi:hypothetical protein
LYLLAIPSFIFVLLSHCTCWRATSSFNHFLVSQLNLCGAACCLTGLLKESLHMSKCQRRRTSLMSLDDECVMQLPLAPGAVTDGLVCKRRQKYRTLFHFQLIRMWRCWAHAGHIVTVREHNAMYIYATYSTGSGSTGDAQWLGQKQLARLNVFPILSKVCNTISVA